MGGKELSFKSTADIKTSKKIIDQVVGQDAAVQIIKKASQQRRHVLLIGEPGTGKCVGAKTPILTARGPVPAEELYASLQKSGILLSKGDEEFLLTEKTPVLTLGEDGKVTQQPIIRAYKGKRKSGLSIRTRSGDEFTVSGDHPILSIKDGRLAYIPSDELLEGMPLATARRLPQTRNVILSLDRLACSDVRIGDGHIQYVGKNGVHSLKHKIPERLTPQLAYLLGICAAEARWQGNLILYNADQDVQERVVHSVKEAFGYPDEYIRVMPTGVLFRKSRTLIHILERLFDYPLETTHQSYKKKVPSALFDAPAESIRSYISGLVDGDGHIGTRGFEITLASKELISGLRLLLLKIGILSRVSRTTKHATNTPLKKNVTYYRLAIYDSENLLRLREALTLTIMSKQEGFERFCSIRANTNTDTIPSLGERIGDLLSAAGLHANDLNQYSGTVSKWRYRQRQMSRSAAQRAVDAIRALCQQPRTLQVHQDLEELDLLVNADIYWDSIRQISVVETDLYDFEVEHTHNLLISSGVTVHNSMLGLALAEQLPKEKLVDVLSFPNPNDENQPLIRTIPAGKGREIVAKAKVESMNMFKNQSFLMLIVAVIAMIIPWWVRSKYNSDIMFAAFFLGGVAIMVGFALFLNVGKKMNGKNVSPPKVIVDNYGKKQAPFFDATGSHAGALLGDVLHDPFQSGGLGTPAHERVVAGMIHKAHMGVLFVDEMATLAPNTQQELLTALQEGKFAITGQSERSAGAMVRTEAVPCNFILVAAGNYETIRNMHPALRSRIRGYGYEVYMEETMPDTPQNRRNIAIFVAQEVIKDKKIPHFSKAAVELIVEEARRRANRKGHLTLRLRELGGLVRAAGDVAVSKNAKLVEPEHIKEAAVFARTLEKQIADKYLERKKEYEVITVVGKQVGRVNGLAVMGAENQLSGIILPIEAAVTPGGERKEIVATGKLGEIAKEAITNVSAIIMKYFGTDIRKKYDVYVQFLQAYEGVEGDSASVAVATAIISALKGIPIRQDVAMTGSLSVRGDVLPVGGVSSKVEAAIDAGIKTVIVPKSNVQDIVMDFKKLSKIRVVPVEHISQVLKESLFLQGHQDVLRLITTANGKRK